MLITTYIPVIFVSVGIASDNLMLSALSGNISLSLKPGRLRLLLLLLLMIQMQAFLYGTWLARLLAGNAGGMDKWIALSVLLFTIINLYRESKFPGWEKNTIKYGLNGFISMALATSVYVFVLGFSLYALQIQYRVAYPVSMITQAGMLVVGWYAGRSNQIRMLIFIKYASLVMMVLGIMVFMLR